MRSGIPIPISQGSNLTLAGGNSSPKFLGWLFECHGFWHNVALIFPSFLFVLYLALKGRENFTRLFHDRSYIMVSYYGCLWLVSLLNLAWCCLQAWECTPGKELSWNVLSLFTTSGMLFLEVSLLAFLLQGNNASGLQALTRTFVLWAYCWSRFASKGTLPICFWDSVIH